MESLDLKINEIEAFDAVLKSSLPDYGDATIITKDAGMESGRAIVMLTFTVDFNGERKRVQTVMTMRNFRAIAQTIAEIYNDDGFRVNMNDPLDDGVIL